MENFKKIYVPNVSICDENNLLKLSLVITGTILTGLGLSIILQSEQGGTPWMILFQGITNIINKYFGHKLGFKATIILVNEMICWCILFFSWLFFDKKPKIGTILYLIFLWISVLYFMSMKLVNNSALYGIIGILITGIGIGMFASTKIVENPISFINILMHKIFNIDKKTIKLLIEITISFIGYLFGGLLVGLQ